jgi:hypothetical protein
MIEIDDFVPPFFQDSILKTLTESNIEWRYLDGVAGTTTED